MHSAALLAAKL